MKLKFKDNVSKKDGKTYRTYYIKSMDKYKNGLCVGETIKIQLAFDMKPSRVVDWTDPQGKKKQIASYDCTGAVTTPLDEAIQYNQYGSAKFDIPGSLEKTFATAKKGDVLSIGLKAFIGKNKDTGKDEERTMWLGCINGELSFENRAINASNDVKTATPSQLAFPTKNSNGYSKAVQNFFDFCVKGGKDFADNFKVADRQTKPQEFINWAKSQIGEELDDGQLIVLYWEIVGMIK